MNMADRRLSAAGNSTSFQEIKVFVDDAIQSLLQNHDVNIALARLKLPDQQLAIPWSELMSLVVPLQTLTLSTNIGFLNWRHHII
jgi:hypothetical protein